jgi:hypothetical protein
MPQKTDRRASIKARPQIRKTLSFLYTHPVNLYKILIDIYLRRQSVSYLFTCWVVAICDQSHTKTRRDIIFH